MIIAGFETSAGTLNWAWYLLAGHPEMAERVVEEARRAFAQSEVLTRDALAAMVYLEQVINETMRLYPPGWIFSRRATAALELGGFDVPVGTDIYISPYLLHRTARYWPDPETFDPERFNDERFDDEQEAAFVPFSLGPRRCIGEYFAMLEMKIHLARLLSRFSMRRASEEPPELDLGINLRSKGSLFLKPSLRP